MNDQQETSQAGMEKHFFRASTKDFKKIPGSPIAYWITRSMRQLFIGLPSMNQKIIVTGGMTTADNDRFLRVWHEVSNNKSFRTCKSRHESVISGMKWFPYNKGGSYRKWFGNRDFHVNWYNDGEEILSTGKAFPRSKDYYFHESLTYTATSSTYFGIRYSTSGFLFDSKGSSCFSPHNTLINSLGFLGSKICSLLLRSINPTIEFQTGNLSILPFIEPQGVLDGIEHLISLSRIDWDSYETSWDFTSLSLLNLDYRQQTLNTTYQTLRIHWREMALNSQRLEEENNRIFIDAYGLQDELTPEVPLKEITLTCNPHYRYGSGKSEEELEALLLADTMREFISYAVGCMFGRYALDKPGLILANQGETIDDYLKQIPEPSFPADADNVIPMLDGDWFTDDVAERFKTFLHITFGDEHYEENLRFIEQALGKNGKPRTIRDYFLKDFYSDHVRRYKKRPIYWLFSSPKGSFNALIYMHRYRPDTVSVILNDYLREFRTKLTAHKNHLEAVSIGASSTPAEKTRALKEIEKIKSMIIEMEEYERDTLYPLATRQLEIDLDDGVKANYPKFGSALKKIPGLEAKDE